MSDNDLTYLNRFGRTCLDKVEERDIDLLILEELICEPAMQKLIAELAIGSENEVTFLEASNSVSPVSGGESDLVALFQLQGETVALNRPGIAGGPNS
jgi:hypothetical protein